MSNFFFRLYQIIQVRKWLIPVGYIFIFLACGLVLWNTNLEEDITKVLPSNKEIQKFNEGFLDSELSNRLVLHLQTDNEVYADSLINFCQQFVDSLQNSPSKDSVKSITYKMDPGIFQDLSNQVIEHLPLFLKEEHYDTIASRLNNEVIKDRTYGAYKALISPASFAFKNIIQKDPLGFSNLVFEELTNFQLDENFELYNNFLLTKDKKHLLFFISPNGSALESSKSEQLLTAIQSIGAHFDSKFKHCEFEHFGGAAIGLANAKRIKKDVSLTVTIALVSLLFLIGYYYRDWKIFFYILLPVLAGGALALTIIGIVKPAISIIAIGVGSILIGISIDFSIHLFTHFKQKRDVYAVYKDVSTPILLSALTTSTAFICLYFVRSEALHDLGLFAALSVFCSAVLALIILPHFFNHKRNKVHRNTVFDKIAAYPYEKNKVLIAVILTIFLFCSFWAKNVAFESDLNKINYMSPALLKAEKNINEISDATKRGIYLISFGKDLNEALEYNAQLIPKLKVLKEEGKIESYSTPNQLINSEEIQQEKINRWNQFWTEDRKSVLQEQIIENTVALKFKPTAFNAFFSLLNKKYEPIPPLELDKATGHLLKDYFTSKDSSATCSTMIRLEPEQKQYVHSAFSTQEHVTIIDKEYIIRQFIDTLKIDFNKLVWLSLLAVLIILHFVYGRPELAWVAFLPICFSWVITLGTMNFFGIKFNIVNIIITSFIFGLGIDYSIFVLRGLLQKYRTGSDNLNSYKASILLSSTTTLIGIGVLIFAKHPALRSIAFISLIGIFSVLIVTFTIQPLLFRWLTEKNGKLRAFPLTLRNMGKTLWVYLNLAIGCIILSIIALILRILFFIPMESRKLFFHKCIYNASNFYKKISFLNRFKIKNEFNEDFKKSSLIVANHKSLIDTPIIFGLTPKLVIVTNDWVANFPLYKLVCQLADFHSISEGAEQLKEKLEERIKNGYSIAIFPEGTRSETEKLLRFKKGAFYLAETLKLDVVPVFIHGTRKFLGKGNFWGKASDISVNIEERISFEDKRFGADYVSFTKQFGKWFKTKYEVFRSEYETVDYHRDEIIYNYLYKGPVTEWYSKVKTQMEDNYHVFDDLIPTNAMVSDLGCGYGYMSYFLSQSKPNRTFNCVDYDEDKIAVANNCAIKTEQLDFVCDDLTKYQVQDSDVFILSDVIHYLKPKQQFELLKKCLEKLNNAGKIIIRDGDSDMKERHQGTKLTEVFSTRFGFNKTQNQLSFLSGDALRQWAKEQNLNIRAVDETKFTSNVIFVMERRN